MERGFKILVVSILLAIILIYILQGLPLIKNKKWKELFTFTLLLVIALLLGAGKKLGIRTPVLLLDQFLSPFGKMLFQSH